MTPRAGDLDVSPKTTFATLPPTLLAQAIVAAVFVSLICVGLLRVIYEQRQDLVDIALSCTCIGVLLLLQLLWLSRPQWRLCTSLGYGILAAQAGLVYLPPDALVIPIDWGTRSRRRTRYSTTDSSSSYRYPARSLSPEPTSLLASLSPDHKYGRS